MMKKLFLLLLMSSFVFIGCKKKDKTKPDDQNPKSELVGKWNLDKIHWVIEDKNDPSNNDEGDLEGIGGAGYYIQLDEDGTFKISIDETLVGFYLEKNKKIYFGENKDFKENLEDEDVWVMDIVNQSKSKLTLKETVSDDEDEKEEQILYFSK